jgi:hypothetical protein
VLLSLANVILLPGAYTGDEKSVFFKAIDLQRNVQIDVETSSMRGWQVIKVSRLPKTPGALCRRYFGRGRFENDGGNQVVKNV